MSRKITSNRKNPVILSILVIILIASSSGLLFVLQKKAPQALYLLCLENETGKGQSIFKYDAARDVWTRPFDDRTFSQLFATPDDSGLILTENLNQGKQTFLWQGREDEMFLFDETHSTEGKMSPDGRILILNTLLANRTELLHMNICDETGCQTSIIPGYPFWSPNGMHTLIESDQSAWINPPSPLRVESRPGIYLGNEMGDAETVLFQDFQRYPQWLTNTTFIFQDFDFDRPLGLSSLLYTANIDGSSQQVANVDSFWNLDSNLNVYYYFQFFEVFPNKLNENEILLYLIADGIEGEDSHRLVLFNLDSQESKTLLESNSYMLSEVSADGRWFSGIMTASDQISQVAVVAFENKEVQIFTLGNIFFTAQDWSLNGEALFISAKEAFFLIEPADNQINAHNYPANIKFCNDAVWGP